MIKVMLAEDELLLLEGIRAIIFGREDMEIVGTFTNWRDVVDNIAVDSPDVLLLSMKLQGQGGVRLAWHLKENHPSIKIIFLSSQVDEELIIRGVHIGVDGFVLKSIDSKALIQTIHNAYRGQPLFSGEVARVLSKRIRGMYASGKDILREELDMRHLDFSEREVDVAFFLMQQKPNRYIARKLHLSEGTVKNYISHIYSKLDVHYRSDAVHLLQGMMRD